MTEVGAYRTLAQLGAPSRHPSAPEEPSTAPPAHRPVHPLRPDLLPRIEPDTWSVPFTALSLPTASRAVTEGAELVRDWHPRDPSLRITPVEPAPPDGQSADGAAAPTDREQRSEAARIAMMVGLGGGFAQNGIDVVRLFKKYPEALRAGKYDPSLGPLGRLPTALGLTAITRPDNRVIDPRFRGMVASVETGGRTFDRFDDVAMKSSVLLGASLAAIQIGASIPNLADAIGNEGPWHENLVMSTSGRAGVLQLAGGTIGAAVFATALRQTAGEAAPGLVPRVLAAGSAPIMALPIWGRVGLATGAAVMANEVGYMDFLNTGEERPTGQVLGEAARKTPVVNDPEWRTAAILGGGAIVGYKAHRAVATAGGLASVGRGPALGAAVVAGLLGAQLAGGLSSLDKRD